MEAVLVDTPFSIGIRLCLGVRGVLASRGLSKVLGDCYPARSGALSDEDGVSCNRSYEIQCLLVSDFAPIRRLYCHHYQPVELRNIFSRYER